MTESIAVGSKSFVQYTQQQLAVLAKGRTCLEADKFRELKKPVLPINIPPKRSD